MWDSRALWNRDTHKAKTHDLLVKGVGWVVIIHELKVTAGEVDFKGGAAANVLFSIITAGGYHPLVDRGRSRPIQPNVVKVQCTTGPIAVNPDGQAADTLQIQA